MGSVLGHLVDWIDTICKTTKLASGDCLVENLHTRRVIDLGSKTPVLGADNNLELPMSYFLDTHLGEHFQLGPASLVCVELHLAVTVKALEVFDLVNLDRRGWATLDTTNNAPCTPAIVSFQQWDNINPSLWNRPGPADTTVASLLNMWRGGRFRFQPAHGLGSQLSSNVYSTSKAEFRHEHLPTALAGFVDKLRKQVPDHVCLVKAQVYGGQGHWLASKTTVNPAPNAAEASLLAFFMMPPRLRGLQVLQSFAADRLNMTNSLPQMDWEASLLDLSAVPPPNWDGGNYSELLLRWQQVCEKTGMRVEIVLKTGGTSVLKTTSTDAAGAAATAKAGHNDAVDEELAFQVGSKRARSEHAEWGNHRHNKPRGGQIDDDNVGPQDMDAEEDNIVELEEEEHAEEEEKVDDNWEHLDFGDEDEQELFCHVEEDSSEYAPSTSN